ncbi:hypothetical protein QQF64_033536 [Cirrhinus molitorella]|uniref:Uncharacterized protein n=1 Tax=Cirrhinus molitorella TaxID=172907 RepID=A0ABR3MU58_9TELE
MQDMLFKFCGSNKNFLMFVSWLLVYFKQNHDDIESSAWHFIQDIGQITRANDDCLLGSVVVFADKICCNEIDSDLNGTVQVGLALKTRQRTREELIMIRCWKICESSMSELRNKGKMDLRPASEK